MHFVAFSGQPQQQPFCIDAETLSPLFTVTGASVSEDGKVNLQAYREFENHFKPELPPEQHPITQRPGTLAEEEAGLDGLRSWRDHKGCGWIAQHPTRKTHSKWISVKATGSWRLAYILARLQRKVWEQQEDHPAKGMSVAEARTQCKPPMEEVISNKVIKTVRKITVSALELKSDDSAQDQDSAQCPPHYEVASPQQAQKKLRTTAVLHSQDGAVSMIPWCDSNCGYVITGFPSHTHCCVLCAMKKGNHGHRCLQRTQQEWEAMGSPTLDEMRVAFAGIKRRFQEPRKA